MQGSCWIGGRTAGGVSVSLDRGIVLRKLAGSYELLDQSLSTGEERLMQVSDSLDFLMECLEGVLETGHWEAIRVEGFREASPAVQSVEGVTRRWAPPDLTADT